jgi:hypothetical protein
MITIDTGDSVFHRPTREWWSVACVQGDRLSWCGWPEGSANVSDCLLVDKATPAERLKLLGDLANMQSRDDHRRRFAVGVLGREGA